MNDELSIHSGTILNADMPTIHNFWLFGVNLQILGGGICSAILVRGGGEKKNQPVSSADDEKIGCLNSPKAAFNFLSSYL